MRNLSLRGFTLTEIFVVIIIIGLLTSIVLPQYRRQMERSRQAEALTNLGIIRGAQLRYQLEDTANAFSTDLTLLDTDIPTGRYFTYSILNAVLAAVATATRTTEQNPGYGAYSLTINATSGRITLSGGTNNPPVP